MLTVKSGFDYELQILPYFFFRSTQNYLNCLNNAAKHCDVNGALLQDLIEKARGQIPLHCKLIFLMNPFISSYLYDNI